jgi:transcription elongation factor GreA
MKTYVTKTGYEKLVEELRYLTTVEQTRASEMLAEARDKGDLSENAEYEAAKEFQENLAKKIKRVSDSIKNAEIVYSDPNSDKVGMVSTVKILNHTIGKEQTWSLVSENEVDTKVGKISFNSPIGSALIGNKVGDFVEVKIPSGSLKLEILEIR